jgi:glutathione S-transferase
VAGARERLHVAYDWLEGQFGDPWAAGEQFTLADCAAAPSLFYADWIEEIGPGRPKLAAYRARLLAHPTVARAVDEGRPYRSYFPLGAPDRD